MPRLLLRWPPSAVSSAFASCLHGRSRVDPKSGLGYIDEFSAFLADVSENNGCDARVATVSGRYYAMDRDNRWERTSLPTTSSPSRSTVRPAPMLASRPLTPPDDRGDEFVKPFACKNEGVADGDAVIFFNFRPDRARQMTRRVHGGRLRRLHA